MDPKELERLQKAYDERASKLRSILESLADGRPQWKLRGWSAMTLLPA